MMTTFPFNFVSASSSHCRPMITDVLMLCQPYFLDQNSISVSRSSPCCSDVKSLVATDSGCICNNQMELDNYPILINNAIKMIKLPTLCGVLLSCDPNNVSVAPSPAPADALESHGLENLTATSAQSPSNSSSKSQSHSSPNSSPSPVTVVESNDDLFNFWFVIFLMVIVFLLIYSSGED
ncbi:hypothetical protein P8452_72001 [Trifolium repens]|nr:hypothetical protein P8452_72001 [Trifolium repens]